MIYILVSICCNIIVSVLLKLARRYEINVPQAVVWNYLAAIILTLLFFRPEFQGPGSTEAPWSLYTVLGVLLPALFILIGISVRFTGIVRTDVAQRLSLFIPVIAAFLLFREQASPMKAAGLATGLAAIICSIPWNKNYGGNGKGKLIWIYPLLVFVGMGVVDVLFKQIAAFTSIPYTSSLLMIFCFAFFISLLTLVLAVLSGKARFGVRNILWGLILGVFNFGNILFYLKAHRAIPDNPSVIFSMMNIGVIIAGALVGMLIFKERLSKLNKIGLVLALIAILIIANS